MSSDPSRASKENEEQGVRPRSRRAFGCVTWFYTGILTLLAVAFLLSVPFRYISDREVYRVILSLVDLYVLVLIVPGTVLAAVLGARTYRVGYRQGGAIGAGIGAIIGWIGFFVLAWTMNALGLEKKEKIVQTVIFPGLQASAMLYAFILLALVAAVLVLFALFSRRPFELRRRLVFLAAALAAVPGIVSLAMDPGLLSIVGVIVSTLAAAVSGWVGGIGYARAGGNEMLPPDAAQK